MPDGDFMRDFKRKAEARLAKGSNSELSELLVCGPTDRQLDDACMNFRHDYGLMGPIARENLRFQAKEWLNAWRKALKN